MKILCISTFNTWGKMSGLTLNRIYQVKWIFKDKILIKNDKGHLTMYPRNNFIISISKKNFLI